MICPQCHTPNPAENKFCRECGHVLSAVPTVPPPPTEAIPVQTAADVTAIESASVSEVAAEAPTLTPAALAAAMTPEATPPPTLAAEPTLVMDAASLQERAAQLLAESAGLEQRGWLADATARAEKAAALLPDSNAPLTALVRLYGAQGNRDKALVLQGQIVRRSPELRAERELYDRMQQEAVRAAVAEAQPVRTTPRLPLTASVQKDKGQALPYVPLAVAGGVAALVFCVGLSLWGKRSNEPQITETTLPAYSTNAPLNAPVASGPSVLGAGTDAALAARPAVPSSEVGTDPFVRQRPEGAGSPAAPPSGAANTSGFTAPTRRSTAAEGARSGPRANSLPLPNLSQPGQVGGSGPVRFVQPAPVTVENAPSGNGNGVRINAKPPAENGEEASGAPGASAPEDPGYIRIQVRPGSNTPPENPGTGESSGNNGGGGTDAANTTAANLSALERARQLQDQGRYTEAIAAYREAIRLTPMPSGGTYQGLAQSYQRAGDASAARANYQVAIRSYETEMGAGQRSPVAVRGLATCRAALEVLGG